MLIRGREIRIRGLPSNLRLQFSNGSQGYLIVIHSFTTGIKRFKSQKAPSYINTEIAGNTILTIESDRRSGNDRRKQANVSMRMLSGDGNRRIIRRKEDRSRIFLVDQYNPMLFVAIVAIMFLCVLDALLTLYLLNHGAYETNPIMAYLLNIGPYAFYIAKYAITIISACGLLLLRGIVIQKLNITVYSLLYFIAGLYLIVVVWELYLFFEVVS